MTLTSQVWRRSYEIVLQMIRWFLIVTYIAVVIATLAECQPFENYWKVVPDPGPKCRQGYTQLIMMGTADTITDLVLVGFPVSIVLSSSLPRKRYDQIACILVAILTEMQQTLPNFPLCPFPHSCWYYPLSCYRDGRPTLCPTISFPTCLTGDPCCRCSLKCACPRIFHS